MAIKIANWCLLVFGGMSVVGWLGSLIAWKHCQTWLSIPSSHPDIKDSGYFWYEIFSGLLYIAFTIFILALFSRGVLFLIARGRDAIL